MVAGSGGLGEDRLRIKYHVRANKANNKVMPSGIPRAKPNLDELGSEEEDEDCGNCEAPIEVESPEIELVGDAEPEPVAVAKAVDEPGDVEEPENVTVDSDEPDSVMVNT